MSAVPVMSHTPRYDIIPFIEDTYTVLKLVIFFSVGDGRLFSCDFFDYSTKGYSGL